MSDAALPITANVQGLSLSDITPADVIQEEDKVS
jgi:hypothetical protein